MFMLSTRRFISRNLTPLSKKTYYIHLRRWCSNQNKSSLQNKEFNNNEKLELVKLQVKLERSYYVFVFGVAALIMTPAILWHISQRRNLEQVETNINEIRGSIISLEEQISQLQQPRP